jgi:hypothetical protein
VYESNTRRKCDSQVPSCNTPFFKGSVIKNGKMPTKIKQLESFTDFKQKLKLFLQDHPFYSLNEFFIFWMTIISNTSKTRQE